MRDIQPFIDAGWHTVPLRGELKRTESGDKTVPVFESNWRHKYQEERNDTATKLGGTITGEVSGIIAIDCDNSATFAIFTAMDPDYTFLFLSKGKLDKNGVEKQCGTFIYKYDAELAESFSINDGSMALDFYSDRGFVYLPTAANETKVALQELPELKSAPPATKVLLQQLVKTRPEAKQASPMASNIMTANCLAPLVCQYNTNPGKVMPGLFRIITPRDFRDTPEYVSQGYLRPDQVPEGRGSEYLSKVSAILGADVSIDAALYNETMHNINNLYDVPMGKDRLDKTILDPMISGRANISGKAIWQYDEAWEQYRLVLSSKRQSSLELCFDDRRNAYYVVDAANEHYKVFSRDSELVAYVSATASNPPKKIDMLRSLPIVNVKSQPNKPFGFNEGDDPTARTLNTFIQTPELAIMSNPDSYAALYKRPTTTLKFLETLVPEEEMRDFLLGFTKRKLLTFEYSPVILYFLGVHGSGKDTYVRILETIVGNVARPTTKEFLEMFNGWLLDAYFVQLDEYGNQMTRISEREEALGKLKAYTGKQNVQIRAMRTDGFTYHHNATFIMTANKNPLMLEDGDRRVALLPTPNVLAEQDWVIDAGGVTVVHERIMNEVKDFAYYLAVEVPMLSPNQYMKPPESVAKRKLVADSMYAAQRLAYCFKHSMKDYLLDLAEDFSATKFAEAVKRGRVYTEDIEPLYDAMTDMQGDIRAVTKAFRLLNVPTTTTTRNGSKTQCVTIGEHVEEEKWDDVTKGEPQL
ncbi:primase [Edwardsiella phage ETP-1]|uniref:Primase n=3 Tax=Kafunavirus KF1 TaxID=1982588 RepID=A0A6G5P4A8_9CAUD|nr:DNA polymerase/primase [Edwardsiella phage KF-1]QBP07018.1 primase [Edwardsiella phage ETP-1]UIS54074.1 putative primase [Edwardsiella phage vB_EpP_ZHX]BAM63068.1 hypothetical protein [Edwardsiella phage KF-1]BAM63117.1 hypothetical protein [Edwardsiella phage IW-1]